MVNIVILYAENSQDQAVYNDLRTQFLALKNRFSVWSKADMTAGVEWRVLMQQQIAAADWVILLVSSNYLADAKLREWEQFARENGKKLIPILARPALWEHDAHLAKLHMLPVHPSDGQIKAITLWTNRDEVMQNITENFVTLLETQQNINNDLPDANNSRALEKSKRPQNKTNMANSEFYENGYALLIGVGYYEKVYSLPITISDAKIMHKILTDPKRAAYPAQNASLLVPDIRNNNLVTAERIKTALNSLVEQVNSNSNSNKTVIIYYSGHGDIHNKTHYLCPSDYCLVNDEVQNGISAEEFVAQINRINADRILVLLDCCYAGGIKATDDITQKLKEGKGKVIVASSTDKQTSKILRGASYSLFTDLLVKALAGECMDTSETLVRVLQMTGYIDTELRKANKQQDIQINVADGLQSFPICAYNSGYAQKNPIMQWLQSFWDKEAADNNWSDEGDNLSTTNYQNTNPTTNPSNTTNMQDKINEIRQHLNQATDVGLQRAITVLEGILPDTHEYYEAFTTIKSDHNDYKDDQLYNRTPRNRRPDLITRLRKLLNLIQPNQ